MAGLADEREKRLAELKKEVTQRGFDRHASVLQHVSELPVELQSPAVSALAECEAIQTIVAFPPQIQRGWHYVPKQALLFTETEIVHLLASIWPDQEPQLTRLKGSSLFYVNITLLLLYGFLEILAQDKGEPARLGMEFSTVDWYCLSPPLQRFLQAAGSIADRSSPATDHKDRLPSSDLTQRTFQELPLKFSNGVKIYGLLPGEGLEEIVFQAGTWKRWMYFFEKPVLANTVLLLTSHYLVLIEEDLEVKQGWLLSYIPRSSITGIQNEPGGAGNKVYIRLKQGDQASDYKFRLSSEAVDAFHRRWIGRGGQWEELTRQRV